MKKRSAVIMVLIAAAVIGAGFQYVNAPKESVQTKVLPLIRLHIIANSNDVSDQQVKLKIRDAIIHYMEPKFDGVKDLNEARKIVDAEKPNFEKIAKKILAANGKGYNATALHGKYYFPPKDYGAFFLPAGEYEALRIVLGNGDGKNWWCVLFPPLCLIKETGYDPMKIPAEIKSGEPKIEVKSKLLEIIRAK